MSMSHPYESFKIGPLWQVVDHAISELAQNGDPSELTAREYIVGYLLKAIRQSGDLPATR